MRAAFQGRDQQSLHLACTLTERLTELDGLVKHGCLPWESLMLLPVAWSVNPINLPLPWRDLGVTIGSVPDQRSLFRAAFCHASERWERVLEGESHAILRL